MNSSAQLHDRKAAPMNHAALRWTIAVAIALGATSLQANLYAAELRTVALTGQPAAGTIDDVAYASFDAHFFGISIPLFRGPVLNDSGQTAFRANLFGSGVNSTNNQGVWSEGSGNLALVARTGSPAPGGGSFGTVLNPETQTNIELFSPVLNNAGQTAFYGGLSNGNLGIWSGGPGSLALVAAEGTPAPGTANGVNFWFAGLIPNYTILFNFPPLLNNAGQTAFFVGIKGSGTNDTNNAGIWSGGSGSLSLLAPAGAKPPARRAASITICPNIRLR